MNKFLHFLRVRTARFPLDFKYKFSVLNAPDALEIVRSILLAFALDLLC